MKHDLNGFGEKNKTMLKKNERNVILLFSGKGYTRQIRYRLQKNHFQNFFIQSFVITNISGNPTPSTLREFD